MTPWFSIFPKGIVFMFSQKGLGVSTIFDEGQLSGHIPKGIGKLGQVKPRLWCGPIDKKDHYIKRCIGLPGDSLQIINRQVYINGEAATNPTHMQHLTKVNSPSGLNAEKLDDIGINLAESYLQDGVFFLDETQRETIKSWDSGITMEIFTPPNSGKNHLFPHNANITKGWTVDNYGPIYIPKKGATVDINTSNIDFYKRIISN